MHERERGRVTHLDIVRATYEERVNQDEGITPRTARVVQAYIRAYNVEGHGLDMDKLNRIANLGYQRRNQGCTII